MLNSRILDSNSASLSCFSRCFSNMTSILRIKASRIISDSDRPSIVAALHRLSYIVLGSLTAQVMSLCSLSIPWLLYVFFFFFIMWCDLWYLVFYAMYNNVYLTINICKYKNTTYSGLLITQAPHTPLAHSPPQPVDLHCISM